MLPFNLLRSAFTRNLSSRSQMPCVRSPRVGEEARDPEGLDQGFELQEYLVLATTENIRQDFPTSVIDKLPHPAWCSLAAHRAPYFVGLRVVHPVNTDRHIVSS